MSIIVSKDGKNARKLDPETVPKEDYLQQYIHENPEAIPVHEIKKDVRLLVLAREFETMSGPIDALGVDEDGDIYVIETKLFKNPDKRRVVAQVLDYGASLWRRYEQFDDFTGRLERHISGKSGVSLRERLGTFFKISEEDTEALLDSVRNNLSAGKFSFVVLMDKLEDRLKDLITFINQNSKFTLYGVELEFYRHDGFEVIIPSLYGAEVRKNLSTSTSTGRHQWDEASFFEDLAKNVSSGHVSAIRKFYDFTCKTANTVKWGTGAKNGSFSGQYTYNGYDVGTAVSVFSTGWLQAQVGLADENKVLLEFRKKLREGFQKNLGVEFAPDASWPTLAPDKWIDDADKLESMLAEIVDA